MLENGLGARVRIRYLGSAPLTGDDRIRSDSSTLVNSGVIYEKGPMTWRLDVFNLFDTEDDDIVYFYASRLEGEPASGVEDIHFHPLEPRTTRMSVSYRF
ncbi:MAG: outer membrane receptor protein involved in Fe transport [Candidatus Azotimanducaceae bacterium]|jgi:outer membrane receptor protein involved in Fe transport